MDNQNNGQDINDVLNDLPKSNIDGKDLINPIQNVANENMFNAAVNETVEEEQPIEIQTENEQETIKMESQDLYYGPKNTEPIINIESNNNDLPTFNNNAATIGKIKPDKQKSPFTMLFLFIVLGAFIIFMPEAIKLANKYLGTNLNANDGINNNEYVPKNDQIEDDGTRIYTITDNLTIKLDKIMLNSFKKEYDGNVYVLNFKVLNPNNEEYEFKKKLYLDFYNSENTFMIRRLVSISKVNPNENVILSVNIDKEVFENGSKVEGTLRTVDDYPNIKLEDNKLTCTKERRILTFNFNNNKLNRINDYNSYLKSTDLETYNQDYMTKKQMVSSMDAVDGVDAILTENETMYSTTITINYETASYNNLVFKDDYYERDTLAKQISFELTSKEYTCK